MLNYFLLVFFLVIVSLITCQQIAKRLGATPVFWGVMGALFVPFAFFSRPAKDP